MSGDDLECHKLEGGGGVCAKGTQWAEDASKQATVYRTVPIRNYPAQNVNSAEVEKPELVNEEVNMQQWRYHIDI